MGALNLPASGAVYVDANCIIYAVEKIGLTTLRFSVRRG